MTDHSYSLTLRCDDVSLTIHSGQGLSPRQVNRLLNVLGDLIEDGEGSDAIAEHTDEPA